MRILICSIGSGGTGEWDLCASYWKAVLLWIDLKIPMDLIYVRILHQSYIPRAGSCALIELSWFMNPHKVLLTVGPVHKFLQKWAVTYHSIQLGHRSDPILQLTSEQSTPEGEKAWETDPVESWKHRVTETIRDRGMWLGPGSGRLDTDYQSTARLSCIGNEIFVIFMCVIAPLEVYVFAAKRNCLCIFKNVTHRIRKKKKVDYGVSQRVS